MTESAETQPKPPRQNRVTPRNEIIAVPARGMFMGNRGCLHDEHQQIVRAISSVRSWVTCRLQFKDRRRTLMSPGKYTEMFFLDEATALAAGHRPCSECRRAEFRQFKEAWIAGNPASGLSIDCKIAAIDRVLHQDRWVTRQGQRTYQARHAELPAGVFVSDPDTASPALWWNEQLHGWTPSGYQPGVTPTTDKVQLHTPQSTVNAIRAGYTPQVHDSIRG